MSLLMKRIFPQNAQSACLLCCRSSTKLRPYDRSYCQTVSKYKLKSATSDDDRTDKVRLNPVNIQMLSEGLHKQVFRGSTSTQMTDQDELSKIHKHLKLFNIQANDNISATKNVNFPLPELQGEDIDEHFHKLASDQTEPYRVLLETMAKMKSLPPRPKKWVYRKGWTKYDSVRRVQSAVEFPDEEVLVMDVEIVVTEGNKPTMATAVSPTAWYSWCSERLMDPNSDWQYVEKNSPRSASLDDLIPVEIKPDEEVSSGNQQRKSRLVIGHNVGFDRSFVRDQYFIQLGRLRFVDTMSLHIAISGMTSMQRILYVANKSGSRRKEVIEHEERVKQHNSIPLQDWIHHTSLNNLGDLYKHYFPARKPLKKSKRDVFVDGTMSDIRNDFQELMQYCSADVAATHAIFTALWPQFQDRFPHPVTLAGMLEMGTTYLPVNSNWQRYLDQSQATYEDLQRELKLILRQLADEACQYMEGARYKQDVWLWDLNWETNKIRTKKTKVTKVEELSLKSVLSKSRHHYSRPPHMAGYPRWYAALCPHDSELGAENPAGPSKLSTQMRVTPKLLRLVWDGFPLHYSSQYGWGVLVPRLQEDDIVAELDRQEESITAELTTDGPQFPVESLLEVVKQTKPEWVEKYLSVSASKLDASLTSVHVSTGQEEPSEVHAHWNAIGYQPKQRSKKEAGTGLSEHIGEERFTDVIPGVDFYRLPHKDGKGKNVGNPLSKDFLVKIEEGVLRSLSGEQASAVLRYSQMCSYWKNNLHRVRSQMVVPLNKQDLPQSAVSSPDYGDGSMVGAILPRVITAGTITRRAVESTWLTASNAYEDRIGSELKAMVQSPPGYTFVGADVDSQELWIASVLGDAHFAGIHGCTALGWMMLQGNKKDGTDMHSMTASLVGISRDQAKVFNYGRIYGAGVKFAERLLMQFNHRLTQTEARNKAFTMYSKTKGKRKRLPRDVLLMLEEEGRFAEKDALESNVWTGGSESHMFNKLEAIARCPSPATPVLGGRISQALEPRNVDSGFMPSRINWVVQSSAVDYLHLLLVSMRWLADHYHISMRLSISIHDELRYLVDSKDRYRAALALQVANLLTRSMFAHKLGMNDLPQSVGFFSAVDLDVCLRKEPHMDCVTPSNPHGLNRGYSIPQGEALGINEILERTGGSLEAHLQPS